MPIRVSVAGQLGVEVDGVPVDVGGLGRVGRLYTAFLVCERHRPVTKDELAEVLWGDGELPSSWEQMLRGNAARLRGVLESAGLDAKLGLRTAFGAYQLCLPADATVDVEEARASLERAVVALRAGDLIAAESGAAAARAVATRSFLAGFSGAWVDRRQADLRELHLRAIEIVAEVACELGKWDDAVAAAREVIELESFRESAYQLLMRAHQGAGNPGEALRVYERCRRVLADELGVRPANTTEAAYLALLNDASAATVGWTQVPLPPPLAVRPKAGLVGRDIERARLSAALRRAVTEGRQVVLVAGEPGMGKSALVADFAREAHADGATVLYGRCDEDVGIAYQPLVEALDHWSATGAAGVLDLHLAMHGAELARIVPAFARRAPDAATSSLRALDSDADRYRLFESARDLVERIASGSPLVLVIDDLHWAAAPTLAMLRHVLRSQTAGWLVVGTFRDTEVGADHPLTATLADLRRDGGVERIGLRGLDTDAVSAIIRQLEGTESGTDVSSVAEAIHQRTQGNPFFVEEFVRHLEESGGMFAKSGAWTYYEDADGLGIPAGVGEVVARRLGRLSTETNRLLTLAAVIGTEFDLPLLEQVDAPAAGDLALDALDALDEAAAASLVAEAGSGRFRFVHALVRDTIYAALAASRRARLHHRVGRALEALPGEAASRLPALAHHFAEAAPDGPASEAVSYALAAARQAFDLAAWEDIVAYARLGAGVEGSLAPVALRDRIDLLLLEFEALMVMAEVPRTEAPLLQAIETARALASPEDQVRVLSLYLFAFPVSAKPILDSAKELLDSLPNSMVAARARMIGGLSCTLPYCQSGRSEPESLRALDMARRSDDRDALHAALVSRKHALADSPSVAEWLAVEEELFAMGPPSGPVTSSRWFHSAGRTRAVARLAIGDRDGFEEDADRLEELASSLRNSGAGRHNAIWRMTRALLDGRFADADAWSTEWLEFFPSSDPTYWHDVWATQRSHLEREQGRGFQFRAEATRILAAKSGGPFLVSMVALLDADAGEYEQAVRAVESVRTRHFRTLLLANEAEIAVIGGDRRRATSVYEQLEPYSGMAIASGILTHCPGAADRYLGQLATLLGRWDDAAGHYEAAIALETGIRSPPLEARTRYWYGRMLVERGAPGDSGRAREHLDTAAATASRLGMAKLLADAEAAL